MEHHCEIIEGHSVADMWTAVCSCGRTLGDSNKDEAEREAREHEEGIEQPWVIPEGEQREWTPDKHPVPGFKMR